MGDLLSPDEIARLQRIEHWALKLDGAFRIPGLGIHVGWDPIVSFIPVVGDAIMAAVGLRLVADARRLGIDRKVTARMYANVAIDFLLGMIPFAGPILDVFFRANARNLKLLLDDITRRARAPAPPSG